MRKRRESSVGELDLDRLTAPLKEELAKARSENRVLKEELEKALKRAIRAETDAVRAEAKVNVLESKLEEARSSGPGTGSGSSEKAMEREMRSLQKELGKERKAREDADHLVQSLRQEIQRLTAQIVTGEGLSMETLQERIEAEEYDRARREALWLFGQNPRDDELRRLIIRLTDVLSAVQ